MKLNKKVGFIGFGRMGSALASGAIQSGVLKANRVSVFDRNRMALAQAKKKKIQRAKSIEGLAQKSDFVFLCVKPQQMNDVLKHLPKKSKACFVSIAAGVTLRKLEKNLGPKTAVIRVMPNTPALLTVGMSALSAGKKATSQHKKIVKAILGSVGDVIETRESLMDAVTAVSGSGPAYVFYLAEFMNKAARKLGLTASQARVLVHQTIFGSGVMLKYQREEASKLRQNVTSPGGTTEAALNVLNKKKVNAWIQEAIQKATQRSKALSRL